MTLAEVSGIIAAVTLIVTNLTALFSAIKANGAVKSILERLNDHSRRITEVNKEVTKVAVIATEANLTNGTGIH